MLTQWGRAIDPDRPLPDHPRPQLVRERWVNLNGVWEHAFTATADPPSSYDGPIVVPFSPEAPLSGVGRQLRPDEWLWYRRSFTVPSVAAGGRLLLHFGAVDQSCTVWVNDRQVGSHTGGYLPFTFDITEQLRRGSTDAVLQVRVRDLSETGVHARGKQRLDRGTIWYTAQSGIWQTVWLEQVPASYVDRLILTPHLEAGAVEVTVVGGSTIGAVTGGRAHVLVSTSRTTAGRSSTVGEATVAAGTPVLIQLDEVHPWSPEDPHLYDVTVTLGEDRVTSYFGLRSFGVGQDQTGQPRLLLNGEPVVHVGVLDQGYWPDGLMTPPSDAAMVHDIETAKSLGFTMMRKHVKIEPLRWYAHCDRLGMLVWQDMVNGGGRYRHLVTSLPATRPVRLSDRRWRRLFHRHDTGGRAEFRREVRETVELLRNVVSLAVWTPFNEGWGQFDANDIAHEVASLDPTRQVNHVSGWVDQGGGDIRSFHRYLRPFRMPRRWFGLRRLGRLGRLGRRGGRGHRGRRVVALTEYGGHSLRVPGHDWSDREFGYRHLDDTAQLEAAFVELHEGLVSAVRDGLGATVYTQLTDVEDELNGLLTWDRDVLKLDPDVVRRVTASLRLPKPSRPTAGR